MLAHAQGGIRVLVTHLRLVQHYRACKGGGRHAHTQEGSGNGEQSGCGRRSSEPTPMWTIIAMRVLRPGNSSQRHAVTGVLLCVSNRPVSLRDMCPNRNDILFVGVLGE